MPQRADEPLTKTTLNLFTADVAKLENHYGYGWSELVRKLVRRHVKNLTEEDSSNT